MSCENKPGVISRMASRLSAGISQLAAKRGFYIGLTLGGAGLAGAGLITVARRKSDPRGRLKKTKKKTPKQPTPDLPARGKTKSAKPGSSDICAECNTPARSKGGSWFLIDNKMYCQDCAPTVAQKAGVDIVVPAREASGGGIGFSIKSNPGDTGVTDTTAALPLNRRPDTRLVPTAVKVALGKNEQGIIWGKVSNGFALLKPGRRNGYDETGLAIVPSVQATGIKNGAIECREDPSRWGIVHTPSGRMVSGREVDGQLVDGWPFKSLEEAAYIGGVLSGQDWARDLEEIPPAQVAQKETIMDRYQEIKADQQRIERNDPLRKARAQRTDSASSPRSIPVSRRLPDKSVEGMLVKDPQYGGIARVVADDISEGGNLLFLVDSTGHRYEISRDEARMPTELDFETYKVAVPLDPSGESQPSCARCQRPPGNDKVWYKMGRQTYCSACAPDVAIEKDFLMPEEIHNDMPEMFPGDRF